MIRSGKILAGGQARRARVRAAVRWLVVAAWLGMLPVDALFAQEHAAPQCVGARAWVTHAGAGGKFESRWQAPDCAPAADITLQANAVIQVYVDQRRQWMLGFGGALTGAAAWLMTQRMDSAQRAALIRSLFAPPPQGIGLSLLRLPIGSTDLSRRRYSLAPAPPATSGSAVTLDLAPMRDASLPVLREISKANPHVRIIASPWSPPAWMKSGGSLVGGELLPEHEGAFADYLAKFVDAMDAEGVPIFAVTLQNEPGYAPSDYPGMHMDAAQRARIIAQLGPRLERTRSRPTILEWDDNWDRFKQPLQVLSDTAASRFIGGVAWHCYIGRPNAQDVVHVRQPDKWQLVTECSDGTWSPNSHETLADFTNRVLIQPARHWGAGTILWSLALDAEHGPHLGGCGRCIGVVTVGADGRVERTRDYYALAHFSAFVARDAYAIATSSNDDAIASVGFVSANGSAVTLVIANRGVFARTVGVAFGGSRAVIAIPVPAGGLATVQVPIRGTERSQRQGQVGSP